MAAESRSPHPNLPGVPWWAAVLIAVIATTIGFAIDAGSSNKQLGGVFSAMYALGCVAAVLAVRQSGIFTAVIQPPLILFVAVPGAYFLFHGASFTGIKDTLINCGYPLIERFPLMLFTTAGVLLVGMARWYFAMAGHSAASAADATAAPSKLAELAAKFSALFNREDAEELAEPKPTRKHSIDRPATAEKRPRSGRPAKRPAATRSRHARPPLEDITEAGDERPRRQTTRRRAPEFDPAEEPPRRRPRPPRDGDPRTPPPRRREPREPRDPYIPAPRREYPAYEPWRAHDPYPSSCPPYEPPPAGRRPPPVPPSGDTTHHPVSRVRYRGSEDDENRGRPRYER
ncbi:DUF6542 domain-containing protein [Candidatus Mycolicibacterium alkanivorans]|uniref:DUF6542 domain-containing protein n=1 Tax=Candidatus Mycolicibacterium alkanivorans TaxID=2954114 RepID=A0ABS9YUI7_9MYCO|nr:DUF6542 domain-containing protein [Candidatus Mycolicibacterium alkanivorans]MCI4674850.1 hypothetical protein [Candidatus Mycolicibacterium alkanivorans]